MTSALMMNLKISISSTIPALKKRKMIFSAEPTPAVNRTFVSFPIADFQQSKRQLLNWANRFGNCCILDNQQYDSPHHTFECLAAVGAVEYFAAPAGNALNGLWEFYKQHGGWLFGHLSYDLKNELEPVSSAHPDRIGFPDLFFFVPETVIQLNKNSMRIGAFNAQQQTVFNDIHAAEPAAPATPSSPITIQSRLNREEYIGIIQQLRQHILRGDCYEINFCQEFFAENIQADPVSLYHSLSKMSPNPFAAFYKVNDKFLVCASPERYLKKEGNTIFSQPIKGTWQRSLDNMPEDLRNRELLYNSAKDRSENVMIVDLVRNDLSKICEEGSVTVDELFGIYSFPQVHQMISTISGKLRPGLDFIQAIKATFPMGSMTGAPKKRVLEFIERYEKTKRGIFSGAVGYITPEGDFDFNVVIRSILYNASNRYLSFLAGSGVTFYSDPEQEYEECLLKAAAIKKVLAK
jgi:para-aminobenzoate synthetase component I